MFVSPCHDKATLVVSTQAKPGSRLVFYVIDITIVQFAWFRIFSMRKY